MKNIRLESYKVPSCRGPVRPLAWLRPVEMVTIVYLALTSIIFVIFHKNLPSWSRHAGIHTAGVAAIILLAWLVRFRSGGWIRFIRLWSPLLIFTGCFEEIEHVVHVVYPGWFDSLLLRADYALLGVHPTLWLERYTSLWLNEYMQLAYTSYFFLAPILGGMLYYRRRWHQFEAMMLSTAVAYYICYLTSILFPTEGPCHTLRHLQTVELHGACFTALINWIESFGRVHGGAFPSAHVAGSTVILLCAYKFVRPLFWLLLPVILSLYAATVYGRYHYLSDVLAGLLVGGVGVYWGLKIQHALHSDSFYQDAAPRSDMPPGVTVAVCE